MVAKTEAPLEPQEITPQIADEWRNIAKVILPQTFAELYGDALSAAYELIYACEKEMPRSPFGLGMLALAQTGELLILERNDEHLTVDSLTCKT